MKQTNNIKVEIIKYTSWFNNWLVKFSVRRSLINPYAWVTAPWRYLTWRDVFGFFLIGQSPLPTIALPAKNTFTCRFSPKIRFSMAFFLFSSKNRIQAAVK